MKASVQYNDLVGTAAADVSDFHNDHLQFFLKNTFEGFDDARYRCVGCRIYMSGHSDHANVYFICYDNQEAKHVYLTPKKEFTLKDMVSMFKRFEIVIGQDIDAVHVDDEDWYDLE